MSEITLEIDDGGPAPRRVTARGPLILLGRSGECDVRMSSEQVSGRHARLRIYSDRAVVEDLDSANGVFVNGARINAHCEIGRGTVIQFGLGGPTLQILSGPSGMLSDTSSSASVRSESGNSNSRYVIGGIVVGCLLMTLIGVVSAGFVAFHLTMGNRGTQVTSIRDKKVLSQTVGLVIVGLSTSETPPRFIPYSTGTAFSITSDGIMMTNRHVVDGVQDRSLSRELSKKYPLIEEAHVWVVIAGELFTAEILHVSNEFDMSILRVPREDVPCFRVASYDDVDRLSHVFAVGFPGASADALSDEEVIEEQLRKSQLQSDIKAFFKSRDFEYTLTEGSVNRMSEETTGRIWIQHDARISGGNSGGPLCMDDGTVVGINTQGHREVSGVNYAISLGQLRNEVELVTKNVFWED